MNFNQTSELSSVLVPKTNFSLTPSKKMYKINMKFICLALILPITLYIKIMHTCIWIRLLIEFWWGIFQSKIAYLAVGEDYALTGWKSTNHHTTSFLKNTWKHISKSYNTMKRFFAFSKIEIFLTLYHYIEHFIKRLINIIAIFCTR